MSAPISFVDTVIFRLSCNSDEARRFLCEAPALASARSRVEQAGCSLFLDVAQGACSLVPLTEEMVLELQLRLTKYHLVALRSDKPHIIEALKQVPPTRRPKVRDDQEPG